jgi:Glycosyl hydrolase family 10
VDWFAAARLADPDAELTINDYDILTSGGIANPHQRRYLDIVESLREKDAAFDGIGFQAHFRNNPTPPETLLKLFDDFGAVGKKLWITEYEFVSTDEVLSADYTRDLMIALFSHEAARGFIMWGFWDGAWRNADKPIYHADWNLKPSGQAYLDLVHGDWWTDVSGKTDASGKYTTRGFYGTYDIEVSVDGKTVAEQVALPEGDGEFTVTLELSNSPISRLIR